MSIYNKPTYNILRSRFGSIGIVWIGVKEDIKIIRIFLPQDKKEVKDVIIEMYQHAQIGISSIIDNICKQIRSFLQGTQVNFSFNFLDMSQLYDFQKKVLMLERQIPYGYVSTYGRLAQKLDHPGAARAVGQALAKNPFPIIIPCHRTIKSDGSLGGFSGGVELKRKLLELEGAVFDNNRKIVMKRIW